MLNQHESTTTFSVVLAQGHVVLLLPIFRRQMLHGQLPKLPDSPPSMRTLCTGRSNICHCHRWQGHGWPTIGNPYNENVIIPVVVGVTSYMGTSTWRVSVPRQKNWGQQNIKNIYIYMCIYIYIYILVNGIWTCCTGLISYAVNVTISTIFMRSRSRIINTSKHSGQS